MRLPSAALLSLAFLIGCDQRTTKTETKAAASAPVPAPPTAAIPATADTPSLPYWVPPTSTDTLLTLNGQPYHLRVQSELDSTQHLTTMVESEPGRSDMIRGYEGRFTFTLRDSLNRPVFRRQLHKADFYKRIGAEVVVQSGAEAPTFLGYSAPFGALVFTLGFAVPGTDWGSEAVLLLDLQGRVIRMANGNDYGGGPESFPTLSKDGYTLLTEDEVLRANRPAIPLEKPDAELRSAFFLSDTALVTVYELGEWQKKRTPKGTEQEFVSTSAQKKIPNAFVLHTRTGQLLGKFRYDGYVEEMGYTVPRFYSPASYTLYLLDENKGLTLLPQKDPANAVFLPFAEMPKFIAPKRKTEVRFEKQADRKQYAFYVDTLEPTHARCQLLYDGR
ncbi:hypothetical protein [Hymenobacter terricola]|uniref:hypothetical protein n=1 Tax=Hymenobacter terricola TaxID=2819236 RepID=UPI001B30CB72|nr:hypothetical protein [Hymenobacter terricola]